MLTVSNSYVKILIIFKHFNALISCSICFCIWFNFFLNFQYVYVHAGKILLMLIRERLRNKAVIYKNCQSYIENIICAPLYVIVFFLHDWLAII